MSDESHGERIVRLETQHQATELSLERMTKSITDYIQESREARQADAIRHSDDHRRIHTRITDEVGTAIKAAEAVAQAVRDARMMGKGAWWLACGIGMAVLWGIQKTIEFFAGKHP